MLQKEVCSNLKIGYQVLGVQSARADSYHIAFGTDRKFFRAMGVALFSILKNNPHAALVFHVITTGLRRKDQRRLGQLAQKFGVTIYLYSLKKSVFARLPTTNRFSKAIYYRWLVPELLKGLTQRVLYLDADIICLGEISEIIAIDLGKHIAAAVLDHDPQNNQDKIERYHLKQQHYFNTGVLLINIERWNQHQVFARVLAALRNVTEISLPDQDALNIVLNQQTKLVASKWNHLYTMVRMEHPLPADTVFLHYTDTIKPWHADCRHPVRQYFLAYQKESPWAREPMAMPSSNRGRKKAYYRLLLKEKKYFLAGVWFIRYHC